MEEVGVAFRSTKDLDIVVFIEALDNIEFIFAFEDFLQRGGYQNQQQSSGKEIFYRFSSPTNRDFPATLELFSCCPVGIKLGAKAHLTPIPSGESSAKLSAILLDSDYYQFIHSGRLKVNGLPTIGASHLIPLKAKAWLELTKKRLHERAAVNEKDIKKHKNDILRLHSLLSIEERIPLPLSIKVDFMNFLECTEKDVIDLNMLGIKNRNYEKVFSDLKIIYDIMPLPKSIQE